MPIIRSVQSPNYTLINNCVFDDNNQLSFGAIEHEQKQYKRVIS